MVFATVQYWLADTVDDQLNGGSGGKWTYVVPPLWLSGHERKKNGKKNGAYAEGTVQEYGLRSRARARATNDVLNHGGEFDSISHTLILPVFATWRTAVNDMMGMGGESGEVNAIRQDS